MERCNRPLVKKTPPNALTSMTDRGGEGKGRKSKIDTDSDGSMAQGEQADNHSDLTRSQGGDQHETRLTAEEVNKAHPESETRQIPAVLRCNAMLGV